MTMKEAIATIDWKNNLTTYYNSICEKQENLKYDLFSQVLDLFELSLQELNNFELLYDLDFFTICFNRIMKGNLFKLIGEYKYLLSFADSQLENQQILRGGINKSNQGYSGFDLENQDGDFSKVNSDFLEFSTDKFAFYNFLKRRNSKLGMYIIKEIKELLRLVYEC